MINRIAVLTSGGDAPGMNAALRAVTRAGIARGWEVLGVRHGYSGLIEGQFEPLSNRAVGGIIGRGGTVLGTSRCPAFLTEEGRERALRELSAHGVDAVVVIGGDGSQHGAFALSSMGYPVVGVASTIDNDLVGSDVTIGVDSALRVAIEAIDRLKITASSHERAFLVEVMGRHCGYLALMTGLAGGAEAIAIPEAPCTPEEIAGAVLTAYERGKAHAIVVVAEGACYNASALAAYFHEHHERLGFELRLITLGHVQRGGEPGPFDRLLGTRLGAAAVDCLAAGEHGLLLGLHGATVGPTPLADVVTQAKPLPLDLYNLANVLAS